jgi:hypothetical protein
MRRRARIDSNHTEIVAEFRAYGWFVRDTHHVGDGFFDLIAIKHGRVLFVEVKDGAKPPSARKLTPDEVAVHADFMRAGAEVVIVETVADVQRLTREA